MWEPCQRYPDPRIEIFHPDFNQYILFNAAVERLYTGTRWGEGPVWFPAGRYFLWSDLPNERILKWEESDGHVSVFRQSDRIANGNTRDRQGRLISCEHRGRRVTRTEHDGSITVLADAFQGKPLNSPNDVIVASDDAIWFTDPPFGLRSQYEGIRGTPELPPSLYRIDPGTGELQRMTADLAGPNGLCFSPDESVLYVVDSAARPRLIMGFDVQHGRQLANPRVVINCEDGTADGIRCDQDGNLWCGWGMGTDALDGVRVFNPAGVALGHIHLPERCANLCFGGQYGNRLFMACGTSLYSLFVNTAGA